MADAATMGSPENPPMGSLADLPAWLARNFPSLTGPVRAAGNAAMLPVDVGADLLSRGAHGMAGLNRPDGENYSGARMDALIKALGDTVAPLKQGAGSVVDAARTAMIERGATPNAPAAPAGAFASSPAMGPPAPMGPLAPIASVPVVAAPRKTDAQWRQAQADSGQAGGLPGSPGAFSEPAQAEASGPAMQNEAATHGAFAPPPATRSLSEEYKKRSGEINRDPESKLTEDQKKQLALNFFLGVMSKSAQPGARAIGAFGDAGLDVSKEATALQDKNFSRGRDKVQQSREDLRTEMGFGDKDIDNTRADRREVAEEGRWKATDKKDTERLALLRQQIEQGNWKVINNAKTGTVTMYNTNGQVKDTGIKFDRADSSPPEVKLLEHLRKNPADLDTLLAIKGKDEDKTAARERDVVSAAVKLSGDSMGKISFDDAIKQITAVLPSRNGGAPAALPAGLPPGSKQVGTSQGKPVYETPDGKRFTVK